MGAESEGLRTVMAIVVVRKGTHGSAANTKRIARAISRVPIAGFQLSCKSMLNRLSSESSMTLGGGFG